MGAGDVRCQAVNNVNVAKAQYMHAHDSSQGAKAKEALPSSRRPAVLSLQPI